MPVQTIAADTSRRDDRAGEYLPPARRVNIGYLFAAPAGLTVLAIVVFPLLYSLILSMQNYNLADPTRRGFIGLGNYIELFRSSIFWEVIQRTVTFTIVSVGLTIIVGLAFALVLNEPFKGRAFFRSLLLVPWVIPAVVVGIAWEWIFNANYGIVNTVLVQLGILAYGHPWLGDPSTAVPALMVAKVWKEIPFATLLFLAGLQTIPAELYEVSRIDGASAWQTFLHITLPLLRPTTLIVIVIETMWTFRIFDIIFVMTNGGPMNVTNMAAFYTYQVTFKYLNVGLGSAMAYIVTAMIVMTSLVYMRLVGSKVEY
jgi:ABC-type sugar transport system permease subunit